MREEELKELDKIDINFVNKQLTVLPNVPSYALFFLMIPLLGLITFNVFYIAVSLAVFIFLLRLSIFFTKKNITFLSFFSMISYIFKPKYIIIIKKNFYKKRLEK